MKLKLITAPTIEPVTLQEAKTHCDIDADITNRDDDIEALISSAREHAEHMCNRALMPQTLEWRLTLGLWVIAFSYLRPVFH